MRNLSPQALEMLEYFYIEAVHCASYESDTADQCRIREQRALEGVALLVHEITGEFVDAKFEDKDCKLTIIRLKD